MARRKPKTVAPARSRPITPSLKVMIRLFAANNPTMSQVEIGRAFNVNPGRVSEAIRGKRK
jgi:Mn-dependent DtxR family transcriptional regulator